MKILEVIQVFSYEHFVSASSTEIVSRLSQELAKREHEVTIYTSDYRLSKDQFELLKKFKIGTFSFKNRLNISGFYLTPNIIKREKEIKNFDIIHMHNYRTFQNIVVSNYAKKYSIPYVLQAEGSLIPFFQKMILKRTFDMIWGNRMVRDATNVIAASHMEAEQYKKIGIDDNKISIVPFGIDLTEFKNLPNRGNFRKRYGIDNNQKIVLYLGRIHKIKGLDLLLDAFINVSKKIDNIKLVIVGPDDGYLSCFKNLIEKSGIKNKILFTGPLYRQDKLQAFVDADVYVLPSFYEDFGITVLEAMACGTPVIITKQCGSANLIDCHTGIVISRNKHQLSSAISKIFYDDKLRQKFGENGRSLIFTRFNWIKVAKEIEKIYFKCLS